MSSLEFNRAPGKQILAKKSPRIRAVRTMERGEKSLIEVECTRSPANGDASARFH
jgi:hypothetical protein